MDNIRVLTAGESHGPKLTAILENIPSGFKIDVSKINDDLARRQQGFGSGPRMKIEKDKVKITAGVVEHKTTGAPIALEIENLDFVSWAEKEIEPRSSPRPGHVDFAGSIKYGHDDFRLSLERASARETAIRVAVGSIAKQILANFNIKIFSYVTQIGKIKASRELSADNNFYEKTFLNAIKSEFNFIDPQRDEEIKNYIFEVMRAKDTLGGAFEVVAINMPIGLGSYAHFDRKLDGQIAGAMMSIPAMKAVEIGSGIENASTLGSLVHDEFVLQEGNILRKTNNAGGLEAGVTNGMPIIVKVFMKPISTILKSLNTVDFVQKMPAKTVYERSDFCAVPRATVVGEACLAFVLLKAFLEKAGGNSFNEISKNFSYWRKNDLNALNMKNNKWKFAYDL